MSLTPSQLCERQLTLDVQNQRNLGRKDLRRSPGPRVG